MSIGSVLDELKKRPSLKTLIKEKYTINEDIPWMEEGDFVRSSSFPFLCAREQVIRSRNKVVSNKVISSDLRTIFDHGHGLHYSMQNRILPELGVLRGKWRCLHCGVIEGGLPKEGESPYDWAIARPKECSSCDKSIDCKDDGGAANFLFYEADLINSDLKYKGHCDGFLEIPGIEGMGVLEVKSIGDSWEITSVPKVDHYIQIQSYMLFTGLPWGFIFYWEKKKHGISAFTEHFVERDEDAIQSIKDTLNLLQVGLAGGDMPGRICADKKCPRAKECTVAETCFELDDSTEGDISFDF